MSTLVIKKENQYPSIPDNEKRLIELLTGNDVVFENPLNRALDLIQMVISDLRNQLDKIVIEKPLLGINESSSSSDINFFPDKKTIEDALDIFQQNDLVFLKKHSDRLSGENLRNISNNSTATEIFGLGSGLPYLGILATIATTYNGTMQRMGHTGDFYSPIFGMILNGSVTLNGAEMGFDELLSAIYIDINDKAHKLSSWYLERGTPTINQTNRDGQFVQFFDTTFDGFSDQLAIYSSLFNSRAKTDNKEYTTATNYLTQIALSTTITSLFTSDYYSRGLFNILLDPKSEISQILNKLM